MSSDAISEMKNNKQNYRSRTCHQKKVVSKTKNTTKY